MLFGWIYTRRQELRKSITEIGWILFPRMAGFYYQNWPIFINEVGRNLFPNLAIKIGGVEEKK